MRNLSVLITSLWYTRIKSAGGTFILNSLNANQTKWPTCLFWQIFNYFRKVLGNLNYARWHAFAEFYNELVYICGGNRNWEERVCHVGKYGPAIKGKIIHLFSVVSTWMFNRMCDIPSLIPEILDILSRILRTCPDIRLPVMKQINLGFIVTRSWSQSFTGTLWI